ncbi:hypothetical protein RHMOL_Rhmol08G0198200 [Rhododendron molle]|uniref:Uncharacterized protein n=1 Tax=Rhododendron molle TaxID=49168 RepID=A0ACC0MRD5_RHOML|nr:hypothetical protein RHMOL_Rhmol08G0198200 [Rhododendron molle]
MDDKDIPGGDQPLRVEVTPPPVAPERDTMAGEVPETVGVLAQAVMAEEATASTAEVIGSDGGDGGSEVVAGYGQGTESSGAIAPRGEDEATGRAEGVISLEERATEAHGGGGLDGAEEETKASPVREPRADLGKDPIVAEEPVEEQETPAMFVSGSEGAGSPWPIGLGDYLEAASLDDLVETFRGVSGLAEALLETRERELQAELVAGAIGERWAEEAGGETVPRRSVVDKATEALPGRGAYDKATSVPFQHVVVPSLLDAYRLERPMYYEPLVLRDP